MKWHRPRSRLTLAAIVATIALLFLGYVGGYFALGELYEWRERCYHRFFPSYWLCVLYVPAGYTEAAIRGESLGLLVSLEKYPQNPPGFTFGPDPFRNDPLLRSHSP